MVQEIEVRDPLGPGRVLVVCSQQQTLQTLVGILWQCGVRPLVASNVRAARAALACPIYVVFCEDQLPDGGFEAVLDSLRARRPVARLVVCSGLDDVDRYLHAMDAGAFDFLCPPYKLPEIKHTFENVRRECVYGKRPPGSAESEKLRNRARA
jgi:DNA-binding NtrC family response regulator